MTAAYKGDGFRFPELVAFLVSLLRQRPQHNPKLETPTPASYAGASWRTNTPVVTFGPLVKREQQPPAATSTAKRPIVPTQSPGSAKRVGDLLTKAIVQGLNEHVLERYGGIYEKDLLPGFPPYGGYSDTEIADSKRQAAAAIAKAAR